MENYINTFFFGYYPYIALITFILGSFFRYEREQYTWKTDSSQLLRKKGMIWASNLFHIGVLGILAGHFVGLLTPEFIYHHFITTQNKQLLAMVAGGVMGTLCFIGLSMLLYRRLFDPRIRATSKPSDILVLVMLYAQLILGLISIYVSTSHMDGSTMVALANWAQHIFTFRSGAADFVLNEHIIFKLHIVLGLSLFVVFPFTRLVHMWSAPFGYLTRKGYQIVRKRGL